MNVDRRTFIERMAAVALLTTAGCARSGSGSGGGQTDQTGMDHSSMDHPDIALPANAILPTDPEVLAAEALRSSASARVVRTTLIAQMAAIDIGGRVVETPTYGGTLPGTLLRGNVGDVAEVLLRNELDVPTIIHWHGLSLRNDMDGVMGVTQQHVIPGSEFQYRFTLPSAGTHWYHSHSGLQVDQGMYAPLIIDDPSTPSVAGAEYDTEHIVVLDDWIDGFGATTSEVFNQLRCVPSCANNSLLGSFRSDLLGGDAGSINYPEYLWNGRATSDPETVTVAPESRVRLRIINAAAETVFHVAVGGHSLTLTHTDGNPTHPHDVDSVLLAVGERVDVIVRASSGVWPMVALAEGKGASAFAILRTSDTSPATSPAPTAPSRLAEHDGLLLDYSAVNVAPDYELAFNDPDATVDVTLSGGNGNYRWRLNGDEYGKNGRIDVRQGQRLRVNLINTSNVWHPMHLHGHIFRVGTAPNGPLKDSLLVRAGESRTVDVICNNPGQWMLHCHNAYHFEAGMAIPFSYLR